MCAEHLPRIVEGGLEHRQHVQRVVDRLSVEQLDRGQRERGQRLVQREVELQVPGEPHGAAVGVRDRQPLDHTSGEQRTVDRDGLADVPALRGTLFVVVGEQVAHHRERVTGPIGDIEQHRMAHRKTGCQWFRFGSDQPVEGRDRSRTPIPRQVSCALPGGVYGIVTSLGHGLGVLHHVFGGLHDDIARGVVAGPAGSPGDLVELPGGEVAGTGSVVLA